jgi:hypothetical protein
VNDESWQHSSFCANGACVQVQTHPSGVRVVRGSDQPGRVVLFDADEWAAFVAGVKAGEFD